MNVSRRSAASLLAGLPFVGRALAAQGGVASIGVNAGYAVGTEAKLQGAEYIGGSANVPVGPQIPMWRAARLALNDPAMRDLARRVAFDRHRRIERVDPDIEVYRSFSPMAKITFQRQRNVDREIEEACSEPTYEWAAPFKDLVNKLMWGSRSV